MQNLFKKESRYMWALVFLVTAHVLYMTYLFPRDWADTPAALEFINRVASIVPVVRYLQQHTQLYTHYWGVFYSIFWIMAPIYFGLGFVGTFYISADRLENIVKIRMGRAFVLLLIFTFTVAVEFTFPMLSSKFLINQMSDFLPQLIWSWFVLAGSIYALANLIGILVLRFNLKRNH